MRHQPILLLRIVFRNVVGQAPLWVKYEGWTWRRAIPYTIKSGWLGYKVHRAETRAELAKR